MALLNHAFPCALDNQTVYLTCEIDDLGGAEWTNLDVWGHCPPHEASHLKLCNGGQGDRYVGWSAPLRQVVLERICFRPVGELSGRVYYLLDTRMTDHDYLAFSPDFPSRFVTVLNEKKGESVVFKSLEVKRDSKRTQFNETGYLFSREILDDQDIFDRNKRSNHEWIFEASAYFDAEAYQWCV